MFAGVPSLFSMLVFGVTPADGIDVSSIRLITNTGSKISDTVRKQLIEVFPTAQFSFNYGLTETYRSSSLPCDLANTHPTSVGYASPGAELLILRDDGSEASCFEAGEVVHCGAGVFMGYWEDEISTRACLLYTSPSPRDATLSRMPSSA